ncbi:predicted protein [Naegleria gruberi]|uniref:Small ribosomal subunit protein mS29 n=1 Tax=Naegleria gruberi TaxID=5762 RepID=D2W0W6_NAEGR|nr:uncharacterized protein NAEGRDRAFT_59789 [Naegleria gruberi]EFC37215.1 predicted protein [Naegleria gruberi]|eukprot:XP_002669959.1 predicted protein [Naegleria gruberi strain NEG-M]
MLKRVASVGSKNNKLVRRHLLDGRLYQTAFFNTTKPSLSLKKTLGVDSKLQKEADEVSSATIAEELDDIQMEADAKDFDTEVLEEIYSGELFDAYSRMSLLVKREKKQGDVPYAEEPSLAPNFSDEFALEDADADNDADFNDANTLLDAEETVKETGEEEDYEDIDDYEDVEDINPHQQAMEDMALLLEKNDLLGLTDADVAEMTAVDQELDTFDVSEFDIHAKLVDRVSTISQKAPKQVMNATVSENAKDVSNTISEVGKLVQEMSPMISVAIGSLDMTDNNAAQDPQFVNQANKINELAKYLIYTTLMRENPKEISPELANSAKRFGIDISALQQEAASGKQIAIPSILQQESSTSSSEEFSSSEEEEVSKDILSIPMIEEIQKEAELEQQAEVAKALAIEQTLAVREADEVVEESEEAEEEEGIDLFDDEEYPEEEDEDHAREKEEKEIKERYNSPDLSLISQFNLQMGDAKVEDVVEEERGKQRPDATVKFPNFRNKPQFNNREAIPDYIHEQDITISQYCNVFDAAKQFGIEVDEDAMLPELDSLTQSEKADFIERQLEIATMPFQSVQAQRKEIKERQAQEKGEIYQTEVDQFMEHLNDPIIQSLTIDEDELLEDDLEIQAQLKEESEEVFEVDSFLDAVILKQDNPYEPFMLATHPHLFVEGSTHLRETDVGKIFIISPEHHKKYFGVTGTGGDLDKSFEQILQRGLLVREPVLPIVNEIQSLSKNKKKLTTDPGYLLMGIQGSGKSACLATCVFNAYTNGVLVVHIPSAYHWTQGIHFVEPSPVLQGYFDAPLPTRDFLKAFMTANTEILKGMKLSREYTLPLESGQKVPTTLYELCDYALLSDGNISVVFKFVLDELINDKTTPMLFAIDDYNFLHDYTCYQYGNLDDFTTTVPQKVHAKNYTLVRALSRIIQQNAPNKLIVAANTNKNKTPNKVYLMEENVLDPVYVSSRYSYPELENIVEYYQSSAFVFGNKENFMEDLLFMSGGVPQRVFKHMSVF